MPRNDYISDKLVNISDRLKQNYAQSQPAAASPEPEETPAAIVPPNSNRVPETPPVPAWTPSPSSGRGSEFERFRRDLEGRLVRDIAAVEAELNEEIHRRQELERFRAALERIQNEYNSLGGDGNEQQKTLDRLRIEYFAASGRASAFDRGLAATPGGFQEEPRPFRAAVAATWPVAAALLLGALVLSATLLVLFF